MSTGAHWAIRGIEIFRRVGGKIVESWAINDTLGMMQQLGVVPAPQKEK